MTAADPLFSPLRFRSLELPDRVLRSSVAGRFDNYDGSGTRTRINWETRFARAGVRTLVSAWCGVDRRGLIVPGYASIERDDRIPFWRELARAVHEHGARYVLQLAHAGRQRDIAGIEYRRGLSSTAKPDPLNGFEAEQASVEQLRAVVRAFAEGARRARAAGLDGVEIHGANGYLFTQFLSSAINRRDDEYGGPLERRARLLLETVEAVRARVGPDFHVQVKLSAVEDNDAFLPWLKDGNSLEDAVRVARWLEQAGADAIHVSAGTSFPHPRNPAGDLPLAEVAENYDGLISSGRYVLRNYLLYRTPLVKQVMRRRWRTPGERVEGALLPAARAMKQAVSIPVLCTGGFQTASVARAAIERGDCDAVTIARPLVANPDLVARWRAGEDRPPRPCTYCNRCLFNLLEHPLGCYEPARYDSREEMLREVYSVYDPPPFTPSAAAAAGPSRGSAAADR